MSSVRIASPATSALFASWPSEGRRLNPVGAWFDKAEARRLGWCEWVWEGAWAWEWDGAWA